MQRSSTPTSRPSRLWLALCGPLAGALALDAAQARPLLNASQPQPAIEEPPIGGAPVTAVPRTEDGGVIRYAASFFNEFQPTTALDMVKRLPGFNFEQGDTSVRGFAAALGNVLIDGQRPTSKAVSLEDVLRRIPFAGVASIEVIRGGAPGINMQGQSVVANVVRLSGDMSTHSIEINGQIASEHDPGGGLRLETSRSSGRLSLDGALNLKDEQQYGSSGKGRLTRRDANRQVIQSSDFLSDWTQSQIQASGSLQYQGDAGLLRANLGGMTQDATQIETLTPRWDAPTGIEGVVNTEVRTDQAEAGVDYEHLFNDTLSGRFLLLQTLEKKTITADAVNPLQTQRSDDEAQRGETIMRTSVTRLTRNGTAVEVGLEGAYNFLDVDASLARNGLNVPLPAGTIELEEKRGEAFVESRMRLSPRMAADLGLRYEISTISQSGDHEAKRTLKFPKPRAMLTFDVHDGLQLRGRIERTVSQLEFRDFASQASLDAGTISGGNADLRPEDAWEFEGAIEQRWGAAAVVLGYTYSMVSDVVDMVPVNGFDTPGNIGDGIRHKINFSLSMPLRYVGLANTQLRFNADWTDSSVDDPVSHESRRISKDPTTGGDIMITREFPGLRSTLTYENSYSKRETSYRLTEVRTDHWDHFMRLYWDWTPRADTVLRVMVNNFTSRPRSRWRTVYDGPRNIGAIDYHEDRYFDALRFFQVQVRKTF